MIGEIIAIGDELTSGRVLNTTSRFAAGLLFAAGHEIIAMSTIGDTPPEISETLKRAIKRADFIIVTGGLGATNDDLTSEAVGEALGRPRVFHPEIFEKIKTRISKIADHDLSALKKLAFLPTGAETLNPEARMAGYFLEHDGKPIFFLPGVPHEMQELLTEKVIPGLALLQEGPAKKVQQKVFKVFGLGETEINRRLEPLEKEESFHVRIGYYPVFPEVHVSLSVIGDNEPQTTNLFEELETEIIRSLGDELYGTDDATLESIVGELLLSQGKMLATAESCSGGLLSYRITSVPGSSTYFAGGVVAYSNDLKEKLLGVDPDLLITHGAVSAPVAEAMAEGIRTRTGTDIGVSVTGIAGPTGGTSKKPVGTVFLGLSTSEETVSIPCSFSGDRWQVQELAAARALDLTRRHLQKKIS